MTETVEREIAGPRTYRNSAALVDNADPVWQAAADNGLIDIAVDHESNNRLVVPETGHAFANMCSCSYLGLNRHPAVLEGVVDAVRDTGTIELMTSTTRIRPTIQRRLEEELGDLFGAHALLSTTCSTVTAGLLPLLASGHLAPGGPRVMIFDRYAHFSMAYVKATCAQESLVLTSGHNDIDFIADACRKYPSVAYVADGAYSMGGAAALDQLLELQDRYGLYLYFDDSHSLSIMGERGEGFVRSRTAPGPLTTIVASLGKGFGSGGGVALLHNAAQAEFLARHGGPLGWSQNLSVPTIGAALGSAAIHRSPELGELQAQLRANLALFDELLPTPLSGNGLPVRRIDVGDADRAVRLSTELYQRGFYSSAVFFPIVPKGQAGLRVMIRADMDRSDLTAFAAHVTELSSAE
ncbi:aminotransferase class I/II-fold pyridoxal phosphate-dependent enzyme [Actinokineospora globicatena]|uniref:8-amino-7-oxononanoate synthase n=1 Tax=Actinokineospora globicatena TaxID=103729 RepID=A0A9W6QI22_9PSEU|nr:aminotransferase class I/II-fold pyridoxal phosphate-dependent enzyme [Actinokineospora globicatena]MCP2303079.1 7-keto-8-aminopelargonate synthetase [Actinokineospora globicatena]GLW79807.1 7-keto-8-aminopelargonate synthetase [Actinokineospora globicatena]GLW85783.1 7-keto-8-aminopelargonate synthetase [Actinokineospora globicatena]GLW90431.1 7-keto-8-aminopelargonate synthetase [Actinokineospora globicatena]